MQRLTRDLSIGSAALLVFTMALALPGQAEASRAGVLAQVRAGADCVEWIPLAESGGLVLTISGPDGRVFRAEAEAGEALRFGVFDAEGQHRPEGIYTYELRAVRPASDPGRGQGSRSPEVRVAVPSSRSQVESGTFALWGGLVYLPGQDDVGEPEQHPMRVPEETEEQGEALAIRDQVVSDDLIVRGRACIGFDCSDGQAFGAEALLLQDHNLVLELEDTSAGGGFPSTDWRLITNGPASGDPERFSIEDVDSGTVPFTIAAGAPDDSLRVDAQGRLGLGTATPAADLHLIRGDRPSLRLEQDGTLGEPLQTWEIRGDEAELALEDVGAGSTPFVVSAGASDASLAVTVAGVGIGTAAPGADLEVLSSDGTGSVVVRETDPTVLKRTLFELFNTGAPSFLFHDTDLGKSWQFAMGADGRYLISRIGTGGAELEIHLDGRVRMGPGPVFNFDMDSSGNLELLGELTATACNCSSSRELKEGLASVDGGTVLETLAGLPLHEWSFRNDPTGARHVGPTSEDFRAAFGLGRDAQHINALDASGVTMAAVQELYRIVQEREDRIDELEARLAAHEVTDP